MRGRGLVIAGSDPSGGAGLQADIKTVTALGGYAMTAVTALTVQNTQGVADVVATPAPLISAQIRSVVDDIGADVIKIGMIPNTDAAQAIAGLLENELAGIPVVLDPVLTATSGDALAGHGVASVIREVFLPRAAVATPNTIELAALTGVNPISDVDEMVDAGRRLIGETGLRAVVLKGGHLPSDCVVDVLLTADRAIRFDGERIASTSTHGTGCTLASAIATCLAQSAPLEAAVETAICYVKRAIETAPGFGGGHGPLNHAHSIRPYKPQKQRI